MAAKKQKVVFKIGTEEFAVDIELTKEVVVMRPITPVPETPDYVAGVMNLRGNLVPVLDLRRRLRAGAEALGQKGQSDVRIIISLLDGRQTGFIVDGASEVIWVTDEMIEQPPDVIKEIGADYIAGVVNLGARFITLLDLKKALSLDITHELDEIQRLLAGSVRQEKAPARA
ncbi:MAG TPA: chemotaxis protein CheW [Blastocatellia bacterium]|nr:chemotaxis protein CheW [Blastocatellia bacterium]